MEIDKISTKRPATGNVQEAAKILKPSIRIESGGIQTTKEVEDVMLLGKKGKSRQSYLPIKGFKIANEPVCVALQETLLKPSCTSNIQGYSILRKDCNTGERACGGVALLINHATPFSPVLIRTSFQAVAVQRTPRAYRSTPITILGDFNAHHSLWSCQDVNSRGKVVEKLLTELDLTLLNDGSNTYFHSPTQSFSAIDLSICSLSLLLHLTWSVLGNPLGSDHFPVVISYATPIECATLRQPRWKFDQADWETFRTQADITEDMVSSGSIDEAVSLVTSCILSAANNAISQPSSRLPRFPKPALIRSKLDYGTVVYSSAWKTLLKILDPVHHQSLRLCLGAFRTSPVESLYAEAYEPPLDLRRKYLYLNHFMKIQSMKTNTAYSYLFNFSLYDFNSHRSSLTYSQPFHFRIRDLINDLNLNIGRIALCKISEMPPWKVIYPKVDFSLSCYSKACTPVSTYRTLYLEHRELFSDYEPIFTDGSKSESHVGSAVVSLSTVITDALPISASIYTAELHALTIAIEHISLSRGKKFIIYTDCQPFKALSLYIHRLIPSLWTSHMLRLIILRRKISDFVGSLDMPE
ncbi:putative RNA-directed DNA polymerase from transposon X-element [Trichonephila clavata]|uniref:Putative RNA-directed DNA polymerase from transposon X-element n=1 Tax=Trichonephila clavata TaxID=2740835 RepID=A0A8X6KMM8_TRICU|nr:putative RNA-directed DNA polymerase from transposon X-element [Trichonephila clavata]